MGYYSTFSGGITFDPPVPAMVHKHWPEAWFAEDGIRSSRSAVVKTQEVTVEIAGEEYTKTVVTGIVPSTDDSMKGYYFKEQVQEILDACPTETRFHGFFEVVGEGDGSEIDLWRLHVDSHGKVVELRPTLEWPDPPA